MDSPSRKKEEKIRQPKHLKSNWKRYTSDDNEMYNNSVYLVPL